MKFVLCEVKFLVFFLNKTCFTKRNKNLLVFWRIWFLTKYYCFF